MVVTNRIFIAMFVLFAAILSVCMSFTDLADAADRRTPQPNQGLLVTFNVNGDSLQTVVTDPELTTYVLSYVAGNESVEVDSKKFPELDRWLGSRLFKVRIASVKDCRSGRGCQRLAGLYAGRSPGF